MQTDNLKTLGVEGRKIFKKYSTDNNVNTVLIVYNQKY
jgi:hypothetical protein